MLPNADHRPWPLPDRPWRLRMTWRELLFAHWPVAPGALRPLIPAALELDLFAGEAWLGIVPFTMTGIRLRGLPPLPTTSAFHELNVRTYVVAGGKPGIYFFSLDAASRIAVRAARAWFHLPYFDARIELERERGGAIGYRSERRGAEPAVFRARYGPSGAIGSAARGSLEEWLTERYCLYAVDRRGRAQRGEVHHAPWPLQPAWADIELCTLTAPLGLHLAGRPVHLHFASRLETWAWSPRPV